jgi:drug/metabolite transporter (DMT)-like permease
MSIVAAMIVASVIAGRSWRGVGAQWRRIGAMGVLDITATIAFAAATRRDAIAVVSVLASLYPAITVALAFLLLRERVALWQWTGIGGVFVGITLITIR